MPLPNPLITEWTSGGTPVVVETHRRAGEGDSEFQSRHDAAVDFWKGVYPED